MEKECKICGIIKPLNEYHKNKGYKYGVWNICKICRSENQKKNYEPEKNREIYLKYANTEKGKETIKRVRDEYYQNNREKSLELSKQWYQNNIEFVKEYNKEYYQIRKVKDKYKNMWRSVLTSTLRRLGKKKEGHTIDILGYSPLELKIHLELLFTDGMTWDNYGEWHVDHIKGVCQFDDSTPINEVNALSNLRPLWATTREINGVIYEGNLNRYRV